jgi:hypothetical protein
MREKHRKSSTRDQQIEGEKLMTPGHFTYRVTWSPQDGDHVGLCAEFPSLSWLDVTPESALTGIRLLVDDVVRDMAANGEKVPEPIADRTHSGEFKLRIPAKHTARFEVYTDTGGTKQNSPCFVDVQHDFSRLPIGVVPIIG